MKERIAAAAIKHASGIVFSVSAPGRHHDVIHRMAAGGMPFNDAREAEHIQGFVTEDARFVDREEACRIATAAGQILKKTPPAHLLFSEDLW